MHAHELESAALWGPILADNFLPRSVCGGTDFGKGEQILTAKVRGGPVLGGFSVKIGPAGPILV